MEIETKEGLKKEMVPSDLSNNSASFRHARSKLRNPGGTCVFGPCAPRDGISSASDQCSRTAPVDSLQIGTRSSERAFRSLEMTARFRATFPRSMLPAYPFGSPPRLHRARSVSPLLHAFRLAPKGANSLRVTRCPAPSKRPRPFFSFPLPLGVFRPLPIKASS